MHDFQIIKAAGKYKGKWSRYVEKLSVQNSDIHFIPEYARIYEETFGQETFLALFQNKTSFVLQIFIKKKINNLDFLKNNNRLKKYFDITNLYGYGGPLFSKIDNLKLKSMYEKFSDNIKEYCKKENIISSFTLLHPFLKSCNHLQNNSILEATKIKNIVYIDLSLSKVDILKNMRKGHRICIKKSLKSEVRIKKVEANQNYLNEFYNFYITTIKRRGAEKRWFLPKSYFINCLKFLGYKRVSLFFAFLKGRPIASSFLIHDFNTVYYHFAGSDNRFIKYHPNHLMIYEITLWAKKQKFKRIHLGGGITSKISDELYFFKSGFSKKSIPIYACKQIYNQKVYDYLSKLKTKHEQNNKVKIINPNFFPFYRRT